MSQQTDQAESFWATLKLKIEFYDRYLWPTCTCGWRWRSSDRLPRCAGVSVTVADDRTLGSPAPEEQWATPGVFDEGVLDVAQGEELDLAAAAFAVVADDGGPRAEGFTGLSSGGAAAWALDARPVVVEVGDGVGSLSR